MENRHMKLTLSSLAKRITLSLFAIALLTSISVAQTDVEIEIVGPWSYVQDPHDTNRILVITPSVDHDLYIFKGENPVNSAGAARPIGMHRLDGFATASCGNSPASSYYLYGANGATFPDLSSISYYAISLPKPCYYESSRLLESWFRFSGNRDVDANDPDRSFTGWMILHYKAASTSAPTATVDNGGSSPITFGTNNGTSKLAISVTLSIPDTIPADKVCDGHSTHAFYAMEAFWNVPHVHRVFPKLLAYPHSNVQLHQYSFDTCDQIHDTAPNMTPETMSSKQSVAKKKQSDKKRSSLGTPLGTLSPGRADCHSPQVNVNGVIH
jgi:hypothetical protein